MIEGLESLNDKLDRLSVEDVEAAMRRAMLIVQGAAKAAAPVNKNSGGGGLRGSIYVDVEIKGETVTGICYTNLDYAKYVEFGTGPAGQANHAGISPHENVTYRQTGWIIPAKAMSEADAMAYGFKIMKDKDGQVIGYGTRGQRARPFMYPALKNHKKNVLKEFEKTLRKKQREISND